MGLELGVSALWSRCGGSVSWGEGVSALLGLGEWSHWLHCVSRGVPFQESTGEVAVMPQAVNIEEAQATLQALLNERVEVVNELLQSAATSAQLRQQADDAERETARLYQAAIRQGWSPDELKRVGITDPSNGATKPAKRRGSGRTAPTSTTQQPISTGDDVG